MGIKARLHPYKPRPEYVLNHLINRIPLVDPRMAAYERMGVRFADRSRALFMLGAEVWEPKNLTVGEYVAVGRQALLDARGGLTIGRSVNISSYTRFMSAKHDIDDRDFVATYAPIVVGDLTWVAMGATVLGGVTIGEGAVVAASAVVTKDVEPWTVVGGAPAVPLRKRNRDVSYEIDFRPNWL